MNRKSAPRKLSLSAGAFASLVLAACTAITSNDAPVVRTDHYVQVLSTAPALVGRDVRLYVREVAQTHRAARSDNVVVFVHGTPAPGSVAFDMPYKDYSWAA